MSDLRNYDPACVLDRLPNKGPAIREAIDWWLADVAPKLADLRLQLRAEEDPTWSDDPLVFSNGPFAFKVRATSGVLLVEFNLTPYVAGHDGDDLRRAIVSSLDEIHRKLVDLARQDPERWRRSVRNAYGY